MIKRSQTFRGLIETKRDEANVIKNVTFVIIN